MDRNVRIAKELVRLAKSLVAGIPAGEFRAIPMTSDWYNPPDDYFEDDYMERTGLFAGYDKNYKRFLEDLKDAGWEVESCKYDETSKKGMCYAYIKIRPLDKRPDGQPPVDFEYLCDKCDENGIYYLEESYDDKSDTSFDVSSAKDNGDNVIELKHYIPEPYEEI